jgi:hypothetical protein
MRSFNQAQMTTERSAPLDFAGWTTYASLLLAYRQVPKIT